MEIKKRTKTRHNFGPRPVFYLQRSSRRPRLVTRLYERGTGGRQKTTRVTKERKLTKTGEKKLTRVNNGCSRGGGNPPLDDNTTHEQPDPDIFKRNYRTDITKHLTAAPREGGDSEVR